MSWRNPGRCTNLALTDSFVLRSPLLKFKGRRDRPVYYLNSPLLGVCSDDVVMGDLLGERANAANHEAKDDDSTDAIRKNHSAGHIIGRMDIAEANGQYCNLCPNTSERCRPWHVTTFAYITKVQSIHKAQGRFESCEHSCAPCKPDKEHHSLKDKIALLIREFEMLRIMTEEITEHVDHENHGKREVQHCGNDCMPKSLGVSLFRSLRRHIDVHTCRNSNQLRRQLRPSAKLIES